MGLVYSTGEYILNGKNIKLTSLTVTVNVGRLSVWLAATGMLNTDVSNRMKTGRDLD